MCLKELKRYKKPVYVTENGVADREDQYRAIFIRGYLRAIHQAIEEGVDVRGYFHWSLMDNYEWAEGFTQRFGLIAVDYVTMQRSIRPSARVYAEICRTNSV
jgi:beta-glucosidase/6-phospho-beta-glucosidase/beta-galactosidase